MANHHVVGVGRGDDDAALGLCGPSGTRHSRCGHASPPFAGYLRAILGRIGPNLPTQIDAVHHTLVRGLRGKVCILGRGNGVTARQRHDGQQNQNSAKECLGGGRHFVKYIDLSFDIVDIDRFIKY